MIQIHYYPDRPNSEQKPKPGGLQVRLRAGHNRPTIIYFNEIKIETFLSVLHWTQDLRGTDKNDKAKCNISK